MWLLRTWGVETVVTLPESAGIEETPSARKVFERDGSAVFDLSKPSTTEELAHPSLPATGAEGLVRLRATRLPASGPDVVVEVPEQFDVEALEIRFEPSAVEEIPAAVGIYEYAGARGDRVNQGHSGEWLHSLAADALRHRASPVATVKVELTSSSAQALLLEFGNSPRPVIDGIVFLGRWSR
jgi:hypothetical protein